MFRFRNALLFVCLFALTGCGGVRCALADCFSGGAGSSKIFPIKLGEKTLAVSHRRGVMWGGVYWRAVSEDPLVAEVYCVNKRLTERCYLVGKKPGKTRVGYVNRFGGQGLDDAFNVFTVEVVR